MGRLPLGQRGLELTTSGTQGDMAKNGSTQGTYVVINPLCLSLENTLGELAPWYYDPMLDLGPIHAFIDRKNFQTETEALKQE